MGDPWGLHRPWWQGALGCFVDGVQVSGAIARITE